MRLLIARHGATQHNLDGRITGQIDAPLSALGVRQAEALAQRLASWRLDEIVSSDLARARATTDLIAAHHEALVLMDSDLREIDMGSWSGKPYRDWTEDERERFVAMRTNPTGMIAAPGGESFAELAQRANRALERTLERTRSRKSQGTVLWVTHGGVISAMLVHTLGIGFDRRHQFQRANCALFELLYEGECVLIGRMNDTSHLEALEATEPGETRQAL